MSIFSKTTTIGKDTTVAVSNEAPPVVDAIIHVSIAENELAAYLNIEPPRNGGADPSLQALEDALANHGIIYNINREKLEELAVKPIYGQNLPIANGIAWVNGIDGAAFFQIETGKKSLKPKENEDGTVDFGNLGIVENVKLGQILCKITLPTEGTPGISVKGNELPQKKGQPAPSYIGKNTELNEDGTAILSQINGHVEFNGNKINVQETFFVQDNVDTSTGNIKVINNLVIKGMILPGFEIEAGGNIQVNGTVEAAKIKAGGSIKLHGGITGSELYCEGDLHSRFIENCNIFVKGDLKAEYILHSNIKCGKNLKVTGLIAKIIGGACIVGQDIEASTIGSIANIKTKLELGTDPTIIERQQKLLVQVPELAKRIESLQPLITLLQQLEASDRLTPEKKQIFDNVSFNYDTDTKLLEKAKKELEEISQSLQIKGYGRIVCTGAIYPGTSIVMGTAKLSITDTLKNTSLYYDEGSICQDATH